MGRGTSAEPRPSIPRSGCLHRIVAVRAVGTNGRITLSSESLLSLAAASLSRWRRRPTEDGKRNVPPLSAPKSVPLRSAPSTGRLTRSESLSSTPTDTVIRWWLPLLPPSVSVSESSGMTIPSREPPSCHERRGWPAGRSGVGWDGRASGALDVCERPERPPAALPARPIGGVGTSSWQLDDGPSSRGEVPPAQDAASQAALDH